MMADERDVATADGIMSSREMRDMVPQHFLAPPEAVRVRDAIASALSAAREESWQPIETAPKEGTFLVFRADGRNGDDRKPYGAGTSNIAVMSKRPCANGIVKFIDAHFAHDMPPPTHWRPLPKPPIRSRQAPTGVIFWPAVVAGNEVPQYFHPVPDDSKGR